ncbi:uncharacterized protein LOC142985561 isoform X2 [Anticarsia gemmatalis]|uniref:uncharacterized protein LOC142985561 isoform X2 n=1 Tax=Anticarsia gemmatalis TaxID=129554 RepID=UPI003F7735D4
MSFDDYAEHIYQKHRLCVALAIINTKPGNLTSNQYIEQLKSNMADNMEDDDVTICSDDFEMDDDESVTILKDFNMGGDERSLEGDQFGEEQPTNLQENSQSTYYNSQESQSILTPTSNATTYYENDHNTGKTFYIKQNTTENLDPSLNTDKITNLKDLNTSLNQDISQNLNNMTNSKEINTNLDQNIEKITNLGNNISQKTNNMSNFEEINANLGPNLDTIKPISTKNYDSDITYIDSNEITSKKAVNVFTINKKDILQPTNINIDSQATILYTVPNFNEYTHYSQSQNLISVPKNYLTNNDKIRPVIGKYRDPNIDENAEHEINFNNTKVIKGINENKCNLNEGKIVIIDDNSQNMVEISQNDVPNSESILNSQNNAFLKDFKVPNDKEIEHTQNINEYFNEINSFGHNFDKNDTLYNTVKENSDKITDYRRNSANLSQNSELITPDSINFIQNSNNFTQHSAKITQYSANFSHNYPQMPETKLQNQNFENTTQNLDISQQNFENSDNIDIAEEEESQEIIPYKVLEELNKVKLYLRRKDRRVSSDGYSTDSGYRSDSQIRSSNRSALQLSGLTINQSAYCLFNYLMQCPLVANTRDITMEIAQALGQLIDRLHDEETYPPFLEELLETIDILLRQIFKGQSSDENEKHAVKLPN